MKVTLTYDFKYRNWTCVFTLLKQGKERVRGGKCQVCVTGSTDILRRQIGRFYTSKLPVLLHLMLKEISSRAHTDGIWCRPVGGTLTFFAARALCHAQHVYSNCESLIHAGVQVCKSLMCEQRGEQERQREPGGIGSENVSVEKGGAGHIWSSLALSA